VCVCLVCVCVLSVCLVCVCVCVCVCLAPFSCCFFDPKCMFIELICYFRMKWRSGALFISKTRSWSSTLRLTSLLLSVSLQEVLPSAVSDNRTHKLNFCIFQGTPIKTYQKLADFYSRGELSFKHVVSFNMVGVLCVQILERNRNYNSWILGWVRRAA